MSLSWELLWSLGVVVLGVALIYGFYRYKTRNKANDPITEAATRENYDHPDAYKAGGRDALKDRLQ